MRLGQDLSCRFARLAFTLAMMAVWTGALSPQATENRAIAADEAASLDRTRQVELLRRLLQVLEASEHDLPRTQFDAGAVVELAGAREREPGNLAAWVAANTRWVPYRGTLRGPRGVLMDHMGNALDRSLLLADLLVRCGIEARLAHATLPDATAADLLKKMSQVDVAWKTPSSPATAPTPETYAQKFGIDPALLKRGQDKVQLRLDQLAEGIVQRETEQTPVLAALVGSVGAAQNAVADPSEIAKVLADHWWVQYHLGDAWADLDTTLGGTEGKSPVAASETIALSDGRFSIPDADAHAVEVRVVAERWQDGKAQSVTLLKKVLRPAEALGQRVVISHLPLEWPDQYELLGDARGAEKLTETLVKPREWVPVLAVGTDSTTQSGIRDDGTVNEKPQLDALGQAGVGVKKGVGGALGAFDSLPAAPANPGMLTAEWIEYEIRAPGEVPRVIRRELFDLVGAAARAKKEEIKLPAITDAERIDRALKMLGQTEIVLQPCAFPQSYIDHLAAGGVLANRKALMAVMSEPPRDAKALQAVVREVVMPPGRVYTLAAARFASTRIAAKVYLDSINILSDHSFLSQAADARSADSPYVLTNAFDIVDNRVAVHARAADNTAMIRLEQGIIDTAAEALVSDSSGRRPNVSDLLASSTLARGDWVTLRAGDEAKVAQLPLVPDAQARVSGELAAGRIVVAPARAADGKPLDAWWSIDPATGQALGMGPHGWGPEMTERSFLIQYVVKIAVMFACIGSVIGRSDSSRAVAQTVLCIFAGMASIGGLAAGGSAGSVLSVVSDLFSIGQAMR